MKALDSGTVFASFDVVMRVLNIKTRLICLQYGGVIRHIKQRRFNLFSLWCDCDDI